MGGVGFEYLQDVVQDGLGVQILVDVQLVLAGLGLESGQKYGSVYDDGLGFYFPPGIIDQPPECLHLLVDDLVRGYCDLAEQLCNYFGSTGASAGLRTGKGTESVVEELVPEILA